jgi:YYY domain-containing protein
MSHFLTAGYWWLFICLLGVLAWPLIFLLFGNLPDRGYAWSKPVGLLFLGLIVWLLGFFRFSSIMVWLALMVLAGSALWAGLAQRQALWAYIKDQWRQILVTEFFGLLLFIGAIWLRSHYASIHDGEKFMEMAFYNAISRSASFPPYDPWMSGKGIVLNYYYLGYLCLTLPAKLLGTAMAVAFNISSALVFALTGLAGFGLIYNLTRNRVMGMIGWAVIFLFGNLDAAHQIILHHGLDKFDWFASSRIIKNTINEFPMFSLLVGDLHPHVMAVPYFLIQIGCALEYLKQGIRQEGSLKLPEAFFLVFWGLVIGSLGMINTWDLPTAMLLSCLIVFLKAYFATRNGQKFSWRPLIQTMTLISGFAIIPYLPFYLNFHNPTKGLEITFQNTTISEFLRIFGMYLFLALGFTLAIWRSGTWQTHTPVFSKHPVSSRMLLFYGLVFVVLAGCCKSLLAAFLLVWLFFLLPVWLKRETEPETLFALSMLFLALLLSLGCEFFYICDSNTMSLSERRNTIFKFYNQVWSFLGMAGVYGGYWVFQHPLRGKLQRLVFYGAVVLLAIACLLYPVMAIPAKLTQIKEPATLDGMAFLRENPETLREWEGINWLLENVHGNLVVLEATGYEYTFSARVSVFTGLPTVMGWSGHEAFLRGNPPDITQRAKDVIQLYSTLDIRQAQALMDKYQIEYVFIGVLEKAWYSKGALKKFEQFMDVVYRNSGVDILRRRPQH